MAENSAKKTAKFHLKLHLTVIFHWKWPDSEILSKLFVNKDFGNSGWIFSWIQIVDKISEFRDIFKIQWFFDVIKSLKMLSELGFSQFTMQRLTRLLQDTFVAWQCFWLRILADGGVGLCEVSKTEACSNSTGPIGSCCTGNGPFISLKVMLHVSEMNNDIYFYLWWKQCP